MREKKQYETLASALDHAQQLLAERFGQADQQAAVQLAQALYSMQARERFELEPHEGEVPYRA